MHPLLNVLNQGFKRVLEMDVFKKHICCEINLHNGGFSFDYLVKKNKPSEREKKVYLKFKILLIILCKKERTRRGLYIL
jgi:hypothetical protein